MRQSTKEKLEMLVRNGAFSAHEAKRVGLNPRTVYRLCKTGELTRVSRGVYQVTSLAGTTSPDYAAINKRVPDGVLCLITALYHHNLTTEIPREIHLAINRNSNIPKIEYPRVRIFRMSPRQFKAGIQCKKIHGIEMKIYSREKTIADCFKYRNVFGIELGFEALKFYVEQKGSNLSDVLEMAKFCRVESVIRPHLDFLS
ncbi:type IV toxin-antitoxin system AbiEi family antitoxin domain-containing protein [bacterium]|nr:type IV toxin-antitoxin system AbiEi family antitoxin domain-containing protein [bacterium]